MKPLRTCEHWTAAEDAVLRTMLANGATDAEIGARVGRTAIAAKQRRLILRLLRKQHYPDNFGHPAGRPMLEPIATLEPHYRPWPCRMESSATMTVGETDCWSAWLPMRARMVALEERDAARDQRDAERYDVAMVDGRLVVRDEVLA